MKITQFQLPVTMITIATLLDEMNEENKFKKKESEVNFEYKGEIWKLKRLEKSQ